MMTGAPPTFGPIGLAPVFGSLRPPEPVVPVSVGGVPVLWPGDVPGLASPGAGLAGATPGGLPDIDPGEAPPDPAPPGLAPPELPLLPEPPPEDCAFAMDKGVATASADARIMATIPWVERGMTETPLWRNNVPPNASFPAQ